MYFTIHTIQYIVSYHFPAFSCSILVFSSRLCCLPQWCTCQNEIPTCLSASGCAIICKTFRGSSRYSWSFTSELSLLSSCSCHLNWYSLSSMQDTPPPSQEELPEWKHCHIIHTLYLGIAIP